MAQLIKKRKHKYAELVPWRELLSIYVQCLVLNYFVICKSVLLRVKIFVKQSLITKKFETKNFREQIENLNPNTTPRPLSNPLLGVHKYVKLKVIIFNTDSMSLLMVITL